MEARQRIWEWLRREPNNPRLLSALKVLSQLEAREPLFTWADDRELDHKDRP